MKKVLLTVLMAVIFISSGCTKMFREELNEIHTEIDDIKNRLDSLSNAVNTNIGNLQSILEALQDKEYVKDVIPIEDAGEVIGYEIVFTKRGSITIYHGEKGQDGHTPIIGVKQDIDGIWYWTLDGEWLKDEAGNKVKAVGIDGEDGKDGVDGTDGKDGVTPLVRINNTTKEWEYSLDNGDSWTSTGVKAEGKDGDAFFDSDEPIKEIDIDNDGEPDKIVITLANGHKFEFPTWKEYMSLVEDVTDHIEALKRLVEASENGFSDYLTKVEELKDDADNVTGYKFIFADGDVVVVNKGNDGHTPVVGVKKDEDGKLYWTIDGEWMFDDEENKVPAMGADGEDAVAPLVRINNQTKMWEISTDGGENWTSTGHSSVGTPGETADPYFSNVDYTTDESYVIFTLADGTEIKIPTWVAYESLYAKVDGINKTVEAIQTSLAVLESGDYITDIEEWVDEPTGDVIGWKIYFKKHEVIYLKHGNDGTAGVVPKIGIKQDPDGTWYWTIDGAWMYDTNGNRVPAMGQSAATPEFKIDKDGHWAVSNDGGDTWEKILDEEGNPVSAQGPKGEPGEPGTPGEPGQPGEQGPQGDSFFENVEFVYATDADGKEIIKDGEKVIAYVKVTLLDGKEILLPTDFVTDNLQLQINAINEKFEALNSIVNALINNEFIKSVTPIGNPPAVEGWEIVFVKYTINDKNELVPSERKVTITNGTDGTQVEYDYDEETDTWYWILDGEPLTDADGNLISIKGQNGVTPKIDIDTNTNTWKVSYDGGENWVDTGVKATGEKGEDGDPFFAGVELVEQDGYRYYEFTFVEPGREPILVPSAESFAKLAEMVATLNTTSETLSDLINALDGKKFVQSCEPFENESGSGYHLVVVTYDAETGETSEPEALYLFNGKDGKNGETPVIGLQQDATTGDWYWTVDGELLLVDGKPVKANGAKGEQGQQGVPGPTPSFRIDGEGNLWVKIGDAEEQNLGKVLGENGEDGTDASIQVSEGEAEGEIVITFKKGEETTGTISVPSWENFVALQEQVNTANSNITALQTLVNEIDTRLTTVEGDVTILKSYTHVTGYEADIDKNQVKGYTISFSNGQSIYIGNGLTPQISIKYDYETKKYYWTLNGEWILTDNGRVEAVGPKGEDGVTPIVKISDDGYWVISYDGQNFEQLKVNGEPVKARGDKGDSMFANPPIEEVDIDGDRTIDKLIIKLADGKTQYEFPTWAAFVVLKNKVEEINTTVSTFSSLLSGTKFIQDIAEFTETTDGKTRTGIAVTYVSYDPSSSTGLSLPVTEKIYNGSVVGIKLDPSNNKYYWTINGTWLYDGNGNKVLAAGADAPIPQFSINENGELIVTVGDEVTNLGDVTGETGKDGAVNITWDGKENTVNPVAAKDADYIYIQYGPATEDVIQVPTRKAFDALNTTVNQINETVAGINTLLSGKKFITAVTPNKDPQNENVIRSYTISFSEGEPITIYNGTAGAKPDIGVTEVGGVMYWTVDGEFITDATGNWIQAAAANPVFKVENGKWYVSYQDGADDSWTELGDATGESGDSWFDNVYVSEDGLHLVVEMSEKAGGETYSIPMWLELAITVNTNVSVTPGIVDIPFTITGAFGNNMPEIATICEGDWRATVVTDNDNISANTIPGKIRVNVPHPSTGSTSGKVLMFVSFKGQTIMKAVNMTSSGVFVLEEGTYNRDFKSGSFTVVFHSDMFEESGYTIEIPSNASSWLSNVQTRADIKEYEETMAVTVNDTGHPRSAIVQILKSDNGQNVGEFIVSQTSATNLSASELANCYIIKSDGAYMFNTYKGTDGSKLFDGITNRKVEWKTNGASITPYDGSPDGKVMFEVYNWSQGNALLSVSGSNGIMWSWHLWMVNDLETNSLGNYVMMDRNLGATSKTSYGAYYQYGRKDPFIDGKYTVSSDRPLTGDAAAATPDVFYHSNSENGTGWAMSSETSWDSSSKSVTDPCPPGFKVPSDNLWAEISLEANGTTSATYGDDIIFPISGSIEYGDRSTTNGSYRNYGVLWNSSSNCLYYELWRTGSIIFGGYQYHISQEVRSDIDTAVGANVRCVRK